MAFRARETFLLGNGMQGAKMHLHVVLCDPAGDPPTVIVVSFNTPTPYTDPTLILRPGDHPFFNRDTAVSYNYAREILVSTLEQSELSGNQDAFKRRRPVPEHVYRVIVGGALRSELIPKRMRALLIERLPL